MKQIKYITLLFITIIMIGLVSCENKSNITEADGKDAKLNFNSFLKYGEIHN